MILISEIEKKIQLTDMQENFIIFTSKNLSIKEMTQKFYVSKQRVHQLREQVYGLLYENEPAIESIVHDFSSVLEIQTVSKPQHFFVVADLIKYFLKTKRNISTHYIKDHNLLIDEKYYRKSISLKTHPMSELVRRIPLSYAQAGRFFHEKEKRVRFIFETLYKESFILIDDLILSQSHVHFVKAINNYAKKTNLTCEEIFKKLQENYPKICKEKELKSMDDFSKLLVKYNYIIDGFVRVKTEYYENKKALKTDYDKELVNFILEKTEELVEPIECAFDMSWLSKKLLEFSYYEKKTKKNPINLSVLKNIIIDSGKYKSLVRYVAIKANKHKRCKNKTSMVYLLKESLKEGKKTKKEIVEYMEQHGRSTHTSNLGSLLKDPEIIRTYRDDVSEREFVYKLKGYE